MIENVNKTQEKFNSFQKTRRFGMKWRLLDPPKAFFSLNGASDFFLFDFIDNL